ncbi:WD repeat and SOCS box-containing protein 1 [Biomphalaria pfeifferi]|uniref:WD repeat and SOCS box-containing protein 1 n=1 Tax=Biomphalaria pfeifferi TaxID=112525 RepID=A0AAD8B1J6_BIOPF|nr:WD repeat and SOCS box-containing protein 1 [Biomphalaria pfeifferi]
MGLDLSTVKRVLSVQSVSEGCLPITPYVTFPKEQWPCDDKGLVTDFHALPDKLMQIVQNNHWYWWCDAQFVPFKDISLFTASSVYEPRPDRRWSHVSHMPNGKVVLYQLWSPDRIECNIYSRTNSTVFPRVCPHPLGELVAYCGTGEVVIMSDNGDPLYSRSRDLTNAVHVYCTVANNGISFACLKRGMGVFFLEHHHLDSTMMIHDTIRCNQICKEFVPLKTGNDCVACKFSPNSKQIAVSISTGILFVVKRCRLEKVCIICPDMVEQRLSSAESFDYDPRFPSEILSFATKDNLIYTIHIPTADQLCSTQTMDLVDCLIYSHDGCLIAAGFHNFNITVYSSQDLAPFHEISMSSLCQDIVRVQRDYPSVLHLSFSQNAEHLASTSSDGHVRLWRIERMFSLQELCRDRVLQSIPVFKVKQLNSIPDKIKDFIVYKYF